MDGRNLFEHSIAHSETIKKFADLRSHIELEDERLAMDKSKETNKVVVHVESAPPSLPCVDRWLKKSSIEDKFI